jgi:hypothetical protein
MTTNIYTIVTDPGVGGTFLAWTLEYLLGHDHMFNVAKNKKVKLIDNPINANLNAHAFNANQCDAIDVPEYIDILLTRAEDFNVLYFHGDGIASSLPHYDIAMDIITELAMPSIAVQVPKSFMLYSNSLNERHTGVEDVDYIPTYFPQDMALWTDMGLTEVYDIREFLALNSQPFRNPNTMIDIKDAFRLVAPDLWTNLDTSIPYIMDYLSQSIYTARFEKWINVYSQWKGVHKKRIEWCLYFDEIITAILNGYNMDLGRFDLDLHQEATIQHELIGKHNLNLKTFELYKFENTKQLHNLLEPNIHDLSKSKIYDN